MHWFVCLSGMQMLHIAAIRNAPECARILLEHGADPAQKNNSDWSALNEALVCRSAETAKLLHSAQENHSRSNCRSHWPKLLETLRTVADFSMHVKWEFGSSIAGPLLRKHMPNDCQAVYKKGLSLRIDGTFNGFEEDTRRMLPRLSRGNYSVVFCGSETSRKPSLLFIDRAEQCYCEMLEPGGPLDKPVLSDNDVSESVRKLMLERPKKRRFKACGFELRPVTSWRGESPRVERIEGWDAHVYDVNSIFKRTERGSPTSNLQGETFAECACACMHLMAIASYLCLLWKGFKIFYRYMIVTDKGRSVAYDYAGTLPMVWHEITLRRPKA